MPKRTLSKKLSVSGSVYRIEIAGSFLELSLFSDHYAALGYDVSIDNAKLIATRDYNKLNYSWPWAMRKNWERRFC